MQSYKTRASPGNLGSILFSVRLLNFSQLYKVSLLFRLQECFGYLYINTGWWPLSRLSSTFAPANTHANVFFVFLPGGISKECRNFFRQIVTLRGITLPISYNVYGPFGECLGRPKIAPKVILTYSVSSGTPSLFCWPNLGCESPLAETPMGSVCWEKKVAPSRFHCGQAIAVNQGLVGRERAYSILPSSYKNM